MGIELSDEEMIGLLAEKLTGADRSQERPAIIARVLRHVRESGFPDLRSYLSKATQDEVEMARLISHLTIHTTHWFRERPHFEHLRQMLPNRSGPKRPFNILSAGCSTGQECYSLGMILEEALRRGFITDYHITGWDIDPLSLLTARKATYPIGEMKDIDIIYKAFVKATGETFTIDPSIHRRVQFQIVNLLEVHQLSQQSFDAIFCKNVLIYFTKSNVIQVIQSLLQDLAPEGLLYLGLSESIDLDVIPSLKRLDNSIYRGGVSTPRANDTSPQFDRPKRKPRVILVDDDKDFRDVFKEELEDHELEVDSAHDAASALEQMAKKTYQVLITDYRMPGASGIDLIKQMQQQEKGPTPLLLSGLASSTLAKEALAIGCANVLAKPLSAGELPREVKRILSAQKSKDLQTRTAPLKEPLQLILAGASTGGPETLCRVFAKLPSTMPPIVIVQHVKAAFLLGLAQQIEADSGLKVHRVTEASKLEAGHIYFADTDAHLVLTQTHQGLFVMLDHSPPMSGHRPSVDRLFLSAAKLRQVSLAAILLTGMGKDGAEGMLKLHQNGVRCLAQDEKSSVVFGMPREAIALGAVDLVGSPEQIRSSLLELIPAQGSSGSRPA